MKIITKATLVLICLSAMIILEVQASHAPLLKRKPQNNLCAYAFNAHDKHVKPIHEYHAVYPGDYQNSQKSPNAHDNAVLQTKAARNFYYMETNTDASEVLKNVAKNFKDFLKNNVEELAGIVDPDNNVSRQATENGTWDHWDVVFREVLQDKINFKVTDVTNSSEDKANLKVKEYKQFLTNKFAQTVLTEIESFKTGTNPKSLLGFLGLVGDIGAAVQDVIARGKNLTEITKVKEAMISFFGNFTELSKDWYDKYCPDKYYDVPNGRGKQKERAICSRNKTHTELILEPRAGVLNVGAEVDTELKITAEKKLPHIGWPWQTVPKTLVDYCPDEPWAGHFSGSLYELIFMLELFDKREPNIQNLKNLSTPKVKKKIYAAIASSFLVATGMHSAVEIVYVVKKYLDEDVGTDVMNYDKVCKGASKYIADLINGVMETTQSMGTPVSKARETNKAHVTKRKKFLKIKS
jgi:hypothetical protein